MYENGICFYIGSIRSLQIDGMNKQVDADLIEMHMLRQPGILEATVSFGSKTSHAIYDSLVIGPRDIIKQVEVSLL